MFEEKDNSLVSSGAFNIECCHSVTLCLCG